MKEEKGSDRVGQKASYMDIKFFSRKHHSELAKMKPDGKAEKHYRHKPFAPFTVGDGQKAAHAEYLAEKYGIKGGIDAGGQKDVGKE